MSSVEGSLHRTLAADIEALEYLKSDSDIAACLIPLLTVMGWRGEPRHVAEALPHFHKINDMGRLSSALAKLNYVTHRQALRLSELDPRLMPCLFVPQGGASLVVLKKEGERYTVFNGIDSTIQEISGGDLRGVAYFIRPDEGTSESLKGAARVGRWCEKVAESFKGLVIQMLGITFLTNLLALAVPLFIMAIYDKVISSGSRETLYFFLAGVVLALLADAGLRMVRARVLAYLAGRIDMIIGASTFQQISHLSVSMTEQASMGAQIARLRQFESIREFFSGPLAGVFLDLPFAVLFILVIAILAGPVAFVPISLVGVFALLGWFSLPALRRTVHEANEVRSRRESFLIEMLSELRTIKTSAAEETWSRRHRELSAVSALANFKMNQASMLVQTVAQSIMLAGGIGTLCIGTLMALEGEITVGALIASMALTWRVLSPMQMGFLSFSRIEQIKQGLQQINNLMRHPVERDPICIAERHRSFDGQIDFRRVSLRYLARAEPAVFGVSVPIEPGELVVITGPNGSGKSTLIKLLAGLYEAQSGAVLIDGIDVRQLDKDELRGSIAYVPQTCDLFHGTIAQNLRLANPVASDSDLARAAQETGLMADILEMPEGFETRLTDELQQQMPSGIKQRLLLARAYVKGASIYLMDEPGNNLDSEGDAKLMRKLQDLKGRATTLVITHRPSHMRIADKVLYLEGGRLMMAGPPEQVLPQIGMG